MCLILFCSFYFGYSDGAECYCSSIHAFGWLHVPRTGAFASLSTVWYVYLIILGLVRPPFCTPPSASASLYPYRRVCLLVHCSARPPPHTRTSTSTSSSTPHCVCLLVPGPVHPSPCPLPGASTSWYPDQRIQTKYNTVLLTCCGHGAYNLTQAKRQLPTTRMTLKSAHLHPHHKRNVGHGYQHCINDEGQDVPLTNATNFVAIIRGLHVQVLLKPRRAPQLVLVAAITILTRFNQPIAIYFNSYQAIVVGSFTHFLPPAILAIIPAIVCFNLRLVIALCFVQFVVPSHILVVAPVIV